MIIQVTGGREYLDRRHILDVLWGYGHGHTLRHGAARGADTLCGEAAKELGWTVEPYPVLQEEYDRHGKAGPRVRNGRMAALQPPPDIVLAFPGGNGTADMVERCRRKGFAVRLVDVAGGAR